MSAKAVLAAIDEIGGLAEDISGYCTDLTDGVADYQSAADEPASERAELREQALEAISMAVGEIRALARQLEVAEGRLS